jgi:group I intron endonuclease
MFEKPAVYLIVHRDTGRVYVGSTSNLSKRWSRHRIELRNGTHRNRHLQAAWNRYGEAAFDWRVLAIIEPDQRFWLEQRAVDALKACDPAHGFNKAEDVQAAYGSRGHAQTPEHRRRLSESNKKAKPAHQVGARCIHGHVKDGTYTKKKANGTVKIRCQECERRSARERDRRRQGIPVDKPLGVHFHRRTSGGRDAADR